MRTMLVILAVSLLSGCSAGIIRWSQPGVSPEQARQDSFECKQAAMRPAVIGTGGILAGGTYLDGAILTECLQARGYTVTQED